MLGIENRRRKYLVNKKLQMQFVGLLVIQITIPTIVLGAFLYVVNKMYLLALQRIVGESVISEPYIQSILNFSVLGIGMFLIVSVLLLIFLGIRFSHQIAGPLHKLEESVDKLMKGEKIAPLHFRKTDTIGGLADKFNTLVEKINRMDK